MGLILVMRIYYILIVTSVYPGGIDNDCVIHTLPEYNHNTVYFWSHFVLGPYTSNVLITIVVIFASLLL